MLEIVNNRYVKYFSFFLLLLFTYSCKKDNNDIRLQYTGQWNFKGNEYSFSSYYIYNPDPEWTYSETYNTLYNDSTGSIQLGEKSNELLFKYCETCDALIYNLDDNGVGSKNWNSSSWTLTDSTFFKNVLSEPPGYNSSYSTFNIQGWKL